MAELNVYEQYFEAEGTFSGVERKGVLVMLICTSEAGSVRYEAAASFFPHREEDDFAVSYDAYFTKELYSAAGRRSKKREKQLLDQFREQVDTLASEQNAQIFWDRPLREARWG